MLLWRAQKGSPNRFAGMLWQERRAKVYFGGSPTPFDENELEN